MGGFPPLAQTRNRQMPDFLFLFFLSLSLFPSFLPCCFLSPHAVCRQCYLDHRQLTPRGRLIAFSLGRCGCNRQATKLALKSLMLSNFSIFSHSILAFFIIIMFSFFFFFFSCRLLETDPCTGPVCPRAVCFSSDAVAVVWHLTAA